jgi:acetyl esterase/lipase
MLRAALLLAALTTITATATAGDLRERLRKRIAQRHEQQESATLPAGTRVLRDVPYGADAEQSVDVYLPAQAAPQRPAPVVVMVHGGGWRHGDKASPGVAGAKAAHWLAQGLVFVSVDYRMLPQHDVRTQAGDVARALAFVQRKAATWGGAPARVVLVGHSAGAHLVALVSAAPSRWQATGLRPWLGTVALDGAALDVAAVMGKRHLRLLDDAFGDDPAYWATVSPTAALQPGGLPLLAVCSQTRRDDPCAQSHSYAARARAVHVRAEVLEQPLSHKDINHTLGEPGSYTIAVDRFLASLDAGLARRLGDLARR